MNFDEIIHLIEACIMVGTVFYFLYREGKDDIFVNYDELSKRK